MQALIEATHRDWACDVVIASQIDMAPYAAAVPGALKILEELELTTLYERFAHQTDPLKKLRSGLTWWKLARYVAGLLYGFDGCTVVSEREHARLRRLAPGYQPVAVVPNGVDLPSHSIRGDAPEPDSLIFSGALTYSANFDAAAYFLRDIFPRVRAVRPGARLSITGQLDGVPIDRLPAGAGVRFTGYLPDIRPAIARSWVSVVPLREGGGTRLKILESLALGTPVVATSKGAEGLDLLPGRDIVIADSPAEFAAAVAQLLGDPERRAALSRNGRSAVEARYDWRMIGRQLDDFIAAAGTRQVPVAARRAI
jgi:glycosyltransferase involved in cell wall biosynthesis